MRERGLRDDGAGSWRVRRAGSEAAYVAVIAALCGAACGGTAPEPLSVPAPAKPASSAEATPSSDAAPPPLVARSVAVPSASAVPSTSAAESTSSPQADPNDAHCPDDMALVWRFSGPYCIDRFEGSIVRVGGGSKETAWPHNQSIDGHEREVRAVSVKGVRPQGYISGLQAALVCKRSGKRLCEVDEWVRACRGPALTTYPYGNERRAGACNDRFRVLDHHPVPILWKKDGRTPGDVLMWHPEFMNDPRLLQMAHTTAPTGAHPDCSNGYGVYDMVGNLHEWVNDSEGTFFGGFFMDTFQNGEGCEYRTLGHGAEYHDYSTGFRCCADATAS